MSADIIERLRRWTHAVDAAPASDLMDEAAGEIERLRSLTRFQDGVIRSGDVACLTEAEREAVEWMTHGGSPFPEEASRMATLRGLLERLG